MDCTPESHLYQSIAHQNLGWAKALAELLDNSFDAGATQVKVVYDRDTKTIEIHDNGHGVSDIRSLVTLGAHRKGKRPGLGKYGVGAKDAWLSCSTIIDIDTVHGGIRRKVTVDVEQLERNRFQAPDPTEEPDSGPSGTVLRFPLRKKKQQPDRKAYEDLAFLFTPAMGQSKQIVVAERKRGSETIKLLSPTHLPRVTDMIRDTFSVCGRSVSIEIGILQDGERVTRGPFWVEYQHRIITTTSIGAGEYSAMRLAGKIQLSESWPLTKNKDDIAADKDELAAAIHSRILPLLQKAATLSELHELEGLRVNLQHKLTGLESVDLIREMRSKKTASGTVVPSKTGRRRVNATKADSTKKGSVKSTKGKGAVGQFKLDWMEVEPEKLGDYDHVDCRVTLNLNHPLVAASKRTGNEQCMLVAAASLIANHETTEDESQKRLKIAFGNFADAMSFITMRLNYE